MFALTVLFRLDQFSSGLNCSLILYIVFVSNLLFVSNVRLDFKLQSLSLTVSGSEAEGKFGWRSTYSGSGLEQEGWS